MLRNKVFIQRKILLEDIGDFQIVRAPLNTFTALDAIVNRLHGLFYHVYGELRGKSFRLGPETHDARDEHLLLTGEAVSA